MLTLDSTEYDAPSPLEEMGDCGVEWQVLKLYKTSKATSSTGEGGEPEVLAVLTSGVEQRMTCCKIVNEERSDTNRSENAVNN